MGALPAVPNVLQTVFRMTLNDDTDVINRVHEHWVGVSPSVANLNDVAAHAAIDWSTNLAPLATSDLVLTEVVCTDLTSPTSAVGTHAAAVPGTHAFTDKTGAGTAARVNRQISRRYRGGRPGVFWPVTGGNMLTTAQDLDATYVGDLAVAWSILEAGICSAMTSDWASSATSVSVSYYEGFTTFIMPSGRVRTIPQLRLGGPVVDEVVNWEVNPRVASQRRRNLTRA